MCARLPDVGSARAACPSRGSSQGPPAIGRNRRIGRKHPVQLDFRTRELTIKLVYKPDGAGQMTIKADVKSKEPALSRGTSLSA